MNSPIHSTTSVATKAESLRALHQAPPLLVLPNAWDAVSARLFAQAGARAIATTSAGIAFSMGYADGQHIPRELMLQAIARIANAVDLPVTADIESGYAGSPGELAETIRLVIRAGAVGGNLEDLSRDEAHPLFPLDQQLDRIHAVREAAASAKIPFVLNARTDVYLAKVGEPAGRFAETVRRLNAFREAGADCLFVPGVTDAKTIADLVRNISGPLNVLAGPGTPPVSELQRLGVARLSVGSAVMRAALATARDAATELLHSGTYSAFLTRTIPFDEVNALMQPAGK